MAGTVNKTKINNKVDAILFELVAGTAEYVGEQFFKSSVEHLGQALGCRYAFVAEFAGSRQRVRTLAFWSASGFIDDVEYDIADTPCETVLAGTPQLYPDRVAERFPNEKELVDMEAESYLAMPLFDSNGAVMGHLAVIDDKPMREDPTDIAVLKIFGARVAAEIERRHSQQALESSEKKLSAIVESTLDAIVVIDSQRHIRLFNPAAEKLFGYTAASATGTRVDTFLSKPFGTLLHEHLRNSRDQSGSPQLWAPEGLKARHRDGNEIPIELTVSQCQIGDEPHQTLILRDLNDRLRAQGELRRLRSETDYLREEIRQEYDFEGIVGESTAMQKLMRNLTRVAGTDTTVLIVGETGVGKELVARAIHAQSKRRGQPLVKVNCAALPGELVESELFGHEKGAFTGAIERRKGRFELAHQGTLFLDEVGELSLATQAKLLRVLQEGEFERVGGTASIKVDVRLIAATNRDLGKMVEEQTFRSDLYYRLNVFPLRILPLRERKGDIPPLVRHLVEKLSRQLNKPINTVSPHTIQQLLEYPWPGNVRELQNVLERCAILADGPELEVPEEFLTHAPRQADAGPPRGLVDVEREHIIEILQQTGWVIEGNLGTAAVLGLAPSTLRSRMKKLGIRRQDAH